MIESTNAVVDINSPTFEVIKIYIAIRQEDIVHRPNSELEHGCRKTYLFTYIPAVPSGLYISVFLLPDHRRSGLCPSVVCFPGRLV